MFFLGFADEMVKTASKAKTIEKLMESTFKSRAGLGAGVGAGIGAFADDESFLRGAAKGAVAGGAAGWLVPGYLRGKTLSKLKDKKLRAQAVREAKALGHKVK